MYYVVTGAAGLVGSHVIKALNGAGIRNVIAVDNLARGDKFRNLVDCDIVDYLDKQDFIERLQAGHFDGEIDAVLHQGACTDASVADGRYLMENNYRYSLILLDWSLDQDVQFIYASSAAVYGNGGGFAEERANESPSDMQAYAKFLFDQAVRQRLAKDPATQVAGLRYFDVYGPGEAHKGQGASLPARHCAEFRSTGRICLAPGSAGGEPLRDFVHVADVAAVNLFFLEHPDRSGVFNVGSGQARSGEEVAVAAINAWRAAGGQDALSSGAMRAQGLLEGASSPAVAVPVRQADLARLREAGYEAPMTTLESGLSRYVDWLNTHV